MNESTIKLINEQVQLDLTAVSAYEEAISACDSQDIKAQLALFRGDHERHVRNLSEMVRLLGGEPATKPDLKGIFIQGFTKLTSHGDRSALVAMRGNEELTNRSYRAALEPQDLPDEVRALFERNLADEQRHLAWIKDAIAARAWDREQPTAPPAPPAI